MTGLSLSIRAAILFLSLFSAPFAVISQSPNSDELAILLNLKQQWGNPRPLSSWNSSSQPCNWTEITCTAGSVTAINLQNYNISGEVPPAIGDLKNLTYLDLSYNYFVGEFPTGLYNCSKLQYLDLSQNYFTGPIPTDIDRMKTLEYLDMGANNFSGDIPPAVGRLTELRTLRLYANQFNGTFPKEIGQLSNLQHLAMAYNEMFVPSELPEEFGNLKNLNYLWMTECNLIGQIPASLSNLSNLEHLDLVGNKLTGPIPDGLLSLLNLKNLYLYQNNLTGEIPSSISALGLVEIDLSLNDLTGPIPSGLGNQQNLTKLILYRNQLSGDIPLSLGKLPSLKIFRVFRNNLTGVLPPEFGLHSELEAFEVSDNRLTGELPDNLCAGGALQGVVASSNNLSGKIPESLGNCPTMRTLQLDDNNFSGKVPSGIWTLFNLSSLMIRGNSFTGTLPTKMAWNLSRIDIRNNQFSGQIPVGIGSWSNLAVFEGSNNLLSGDIPEEITALSELLTLSLDGNQLSGEFPSRIISWASLNTLNVSRNKLSGAIPSAIGSLPDLLNLDISENQFSGVIPPELGKLRLTTLNMSSNKLTGKIPDAYNNLAYENSFLDNPDLCVDSPILKLRSCNAEGTNNDKLSPKYLALILILAVVVFLVTGFSTLVMIRDYRRKKLGRDLSTWKLTSFHRLDFTEANILSNLTEGNLIGSGGSGKVYRIEVGRSGDYVAVKRIWNTMKLDPKLEKEFLAEVEILGTIRHSNIVKLLCCISSEDSRLLVYEYKPNESLDRWLHKSKRKPISNREGSPLRVFLDWPTRLQIAIGAARGLCYMHHDCSPPIIHRDVKSSNILLDSEFNASIADFGLARIVAKHGEAQTMSSIAGSFGYFAPEYAYTTKVNEKIDIYSFGVVLLELVTGREPNSGDEHSSLAEWAWRHFGEDKPILDAIDDEIKELRYLEDIATVFKLGLNCTSSFPSTRPSMKEALHVLQRCSPSEGLRNKVGREFDVTPLLGNETYLSSYRKSRKIVDEEGGCLVFSV